MFSNREGVGLGEVHDQMPSSVAPEYYEDNGEKTWVRNEDSIISSEVNITVTPSGINMVKLASSGNLSSPSAKFWLSEERDQISQSIPSSTSQGLGGRCKEWISNPSNMVFLLWISCVAVSGAIVFLVITGMLNNVLLKQSERDDWFEVNNQILNALFTLMSLYQHPKRFHCLVLLFRWKPKDVCMLRKIYAKNGRRKPHERAHMMVVVLLLHINCFAQYALCGLNLGYKRSERPSLPTGICLVLAIATAVSAGVYSSVSPLGKEYDSQVDSETKDQISNNATGHTVKQKFSMEKRFSFASNEHRTVEFAPVWRGGLFNIWDDIAVATRSVFCSFCVLGWNLERLGFGNMYVHIATFLLVCTAPFFIFSLAAIHIDKEIVREAFGITGIMLSVFGLLYGGLWRIQMRKRFNLPANNSCCAKPEIADCAQWLLCCSCSLAQEVRTANYYDIVEDKFCKKHADGNGQLTLSALALEDGLVQFRSSPTSLIWNNPGASRSGTENSPTPARQLPEVEDEHSSKDDHYFLKPPVRPSMQRDGSTNQKP